MGIKMIGIDYTTASLSERELFAFTTAQAHEAMIECVELPGINGCVIISTCNRTELWLDAEDTYSIDMKELLCTLKQLSSVGLKDCFTLRDGNEAVRHLFEASCGIKSQIWGEDQILAQVKNAIENARVAGTANERLEKLFQYAITSAKKVKTDIRLTTADVSVASKTMEVIKTYFGPQEDVRCLVIGSGVMGRMIAAMIAAQGIPVQITMRKFKKGFSIVPPGCQAIHYDNRHEKLNECNLIISATLSPHYTIKVSEITAKITDNIPRLLIDLAVPRDIEPGIADLPNITLINTDSLGRVLVSDQNQHLMTQTTQIIDKYIEDFMAWTKTREYLPMIDRIAESSSEKIRLDMVKEIDEFIANSEQKVEFEQKLTQVTANMIKNILFRLKDNLANDQWEACFGDLHKERAKKESSSS